MELIEHLNWRYATKKFDPVKKIPPEALEQLKDVIQLSASSYGLQWYKVLIIENQRIKEELFSYANQHQILDCSHLFVICNYTSFTNDDVDGFITRLADTLQVSRSTVVEYGDFIKNELTGKSPAERTSWLKSQTYIALANLIAGAAELKIDACPMEGFQAGKFNEILGLNEQGLNACVIAAIGYRHSDDPASARKKFRRPKEELFVQI
ncbi:Nitroreductase [Chitinophaga sp. CF118]|uniref:NAD(P)H-dependent oxidoreductase n=1 Tax=Chitinophaga sp. CF118 TaxID=1884367 RepID=UPI0008F06315|nr:NAD(P)H-dependent oxidoreductase [Chitinophaga sp. CF118]SFE61916.1 Nitroreductase [Chitinophaga sp. CF118]